MLAYPPLHWNPYADTTVASPPTDTALTGIMTLGYAADDPAVPTAHLAKRSDPPIWSPECARQNPPRVSRDIPSLEKDGSPETLPCLSRGRRVSVSLLVR